MPWGCDFQSKFLFWSSLSNCSNLHGRSLAGEKDRTYLWKGITSLILSLSSSQNLFHLKLKRKLNPMNNFFWTNWTFHNFSCQQSLLFPCSVLCCHKKILFLLYINRSHFFLSVYLIVALFSCCILFNRSTDHSAISAAAWLEIAAAIAKKIADIMRSK